MDGAARLNDAQGEGLEFDWVVVSPSTARFPLDPSEVDRAGARQEEARILYVGMTRARERLCFGWGDREKAWWNGSGFPGQNASRVELTGSLEEIYLSWPGQPNQALLQRYLRTKVRLGDRVAVRGRAVVHEQTEIGVLASGVAVASGLATVVRVLRYPALPRKADGSENPHYAALSDESKRRGWFWVATFRSV